jgi:hypothetical protein
MVYHFSKRSRQPPTWFELKHAILRNFGGMDHVNPLEVFEKHLLGIPKPVEKRENDPSCTAQGLIKACLFGEGLEGINKYVILIVLNSWNNLRSNC